jgi:excisionase family DNA binding protein
MTYERPDSHSSDRRADASRADDQSGPAAALRRGKLDELRRRSTCSVEEASVLLGVGRSTAYAAARDGSLPVLRISKRLLVPTAKLLAMIGVEQTGQEPQPGEPEKS